MTSRPKRGGTLLKTSRMRFPLAYVRYLRFVPFLVLKTTRIRTYKLRVHSEMAGALAASTLHPWIVSLSQKTILGVSFVYLELTREGGSLCPGTQLLLQKKTNTNAIAWVCVHAHTRHAVVVVVPFSAAHAKSSTCSSKKSRKKA